MNIKRISTILIVFLLILCTLNVASAGMFDFLGSNDSNSTGDGKAETVIIVHKAFDTKENTYSAIVKLGENTTNGTNYLSNKSLEVNITDPNGETQQYNLTTDENGMSIINSMPPGIYKFSVKFNGDDKLRNCSFNESVDLTKP